jgi:hypothetical protein
MRAILLTTDCRITPVEVDGTLESLQAQVGGDIEALVIPEGAFGTLGGTMYINENGKAEGLPRNRYAQRVCRKGGVALPADDYIVGPALIMGLPDDDGDDQPITPGLEEALLGIGQHSNAP